MTAGVSFVAVLGASIIGRGSIWFDEAFSEHISRHTFWDIARFTAADVHPPLYYWLLKIWRVFFGDTEVALRSLSLVCLVVAVTVAYVAVRRLFDRRAAIVSMVFLALSPVLFRYGVEARMYTLELLIVIAATVALLYAIRHSQLRRGWVVYGVLIGLGLLTHYLSAVVWVAQGLWVLWRYRGEKLLTTIKQAMHSGYKYAVMAAIGVSLVWLPFMLWQLVNIQGGGFWIGPVTLHTLPDFVSNAYTYVGGDSLYGWHAVGLLIAVGAGSGVVVLGLRLLTGDKKQAFTLLLATAVLPPLLLVAGSMPPLRSSFVDRYLLASVAMWLLSLGIAVAVVWHRKGNAGLLAKAVFVLTCGLLALGCYQVYQVGNVNKDNGSAHRMRSAMDLVGAHAAAGEPVIADTSWHYYEASFYETAEHEVYFRSEDHTKIGAYEMLREEYDRKITDMADFGRKHPVVWFVTAQPRDVGSRIPAGWREEESYLVENPSLLRVVKIRYGGN